VATDVTNYKGYSEQLPTRPRHSTCDGSKRYYRFLEGKHWTWAHTGRLNAKAWPIGCILIISHCLKQPRQDCRRAVLTLTIHTCTLWLQALCSFPEIEFRNCSQVAMLSIKE